MESKISTSEKNKTIWIVDVLTKRGVDTSLSGFATEYELLAKVYDHTKWKGKNGRWCAHIRIDGKRKLLSKATEEELEEALEEYYSKDFAPYFEQAFHEMLDDKKDDLKVNSITRYNNVFNRLCKGSKHEFMNTRVSVMQDSIIEDFIVVTIRKFKLNRKAYAGLRTIIRETLRYAKRKGYTKFQVTSFFEDLELSKSLFKPKMKTTDETVYTTSEIKKIREICEKKKEPKYKVLELLTYTGMRVGEAVAVLPTDVVGNKLSINKTEISYNDGEKYVVTINNSAKQGHNRAIPIVDKAKELIASGPFNVTTRQVRYALAQVCKEAKISALHPHSIRKWYASFLLDSGALSDASIQKLLGHEDITTTRTYYQRDISDETQTLKKLQDIMK